MRRSTTVVSTAVPEKSHLLRRVGLLGATAALLFTGITVGSSASAATDVNNPHGGTTFSVRAGNQVTFTGWTYDPNASGASIRVEYSLDGRTKETASANRPGPGANRINHITGNHGFSRAWTLPVGTHTVCVRALDVGAGNANPVIGCKAVTVRPKPTLNQQISGFAKSFVGKARYVSGGRSPRTGFDCSGLTSYVYGHYGKRIAPVARAQYLSFRKISRASARPGDLVFFHSGGGTWHVGVYMGGTMMVAAATPAQGIRYQTWTWWPNVTFGTSTH